MRLVLLMHKPLAGGQLALLLNASRHALNASNEPGSSLTPSTCAKTLAEKTRQDKAPFFSNRLSEVPTSALTIGTGTLLEAKKIMVLVRGYHHQSLALQAAVVQLSLGYFVAAMTP